MILRRGIGFSRRRKALLGVVLAMLALMLLLRWLGVAAFNGTEVRDMDWNADGEVTRDEILQGWYAVGVETTTEGVRTCRTYAWLRDRATPIRVDCRSEIGAVSGDR